jgi:hypothetical protein
MKIRRVVVRERILFVIKKSLIILPKTTQTQLAIYGIAESKPLE